MMLTQCETKLKEPYFNENYFRQIKFEMSYFFQRRNRFKLKIPSLSKIIKNSNIDQLRRQFFFANSFDTQSTFFPPFLLGALANDLFLMFNNEFFLFLTFFFSVTPHKINLRGKKVAHKPKDP